MPFVNLAEILSDVARGGPHRIRERKKPCHDIRHRQTLKVGAIRRLSNFLVETRLAVAANHGLRLWIERNVNGSYVMAGRTVANSSHCIPYCTTSLKDWPNDNE